MHDFVFETVGQTGLRFRRFVETRQHHQLGAERFAVKLNRFFAAPAEKEIRLHVSVGCTHTAILRRDRARVNQIAESPAAWWLSVARNRASLPGDALARRKGKRER